MFTGRLVTILSAALLALGFACLTQAQVPMTGAGLGKPAAGGSLVTVTWAGNSELTTSASTYSAVPIGSANANRVVVVAVGARMVTAGSGVTSVILHIPDLGTDPTGTTLTSVSGTGSGSPDNVQTEIFYAAIASGTVADVTIVFGVGGTLRSGISTWTVITTTATPSDGQANEAQSGSSMTKSVTVPSNGGAIAFYYTRSNTPNGTIFPFAWTNATKNYEASIVSGASDLAGMSGSVVSGTGSVSVTVTPASTPTAGGMAMSLAAWGP